MNEPNFYPQWVLKNRYINKAIRTLGRDAPAKFMRQFGEPGDVALEKLGSDYGGWFAPVSLINSSWVVYSLGIGQDTTFDRAMMERFGCTVYGFDPTPPAREHVEEQKKITPAFERFHFQPIAVWSEEKTLRLFEPKTRGWVGSYSALNLQGTERYIDVPAKPISLLMKENSHTHIDMLKMDIEGAEHGVIGTLLDARIPIRWLCVELDQPVPHKTIHNLVSRIISSGYKLRHVDSWNFTFQHVG